MSQWYQHSEPGGACNDPLSPVSISLHGGRLVYTGKIQVR